MWAIVAASKDVPGADELRDDIRLSLTAEQVRQAESRARDFLPRAQ